MSKIYDAQDRITALLQADSYFTGIPIISQRVGDIANELAANLDSLGIGILVMLPKINWEGQSQRIALSLVFVVVVSENPTINLTGKTAEAVMEKIFGLIHWQANSATPAGSIAQPPKFHIDNPAAENIGTSPKFPQVLNYALNFRTSILLP